MAVDGPFDSAWLKWGRAVGHAQALDADIEGAAANSNTEPGTIRIEYQPQRHGFSAWVETVPDIPPLWGLMLGDVVFNFRASLDHLAWALVQRGNQAGRLSLEEERSVYFPIASSASHLKYMLYGARFSRLPGVRRADLTRVRRHQPYHRGKTRTPWHCLSILDRLSNIDKHRQVHAVSLIPEIRKFEIRECHRCVVTRSTVRAYRRPADVGTEIAFVRVRRTGPNPQLDVDYDVTAHPAFHPRLWLQHWLDITTIATMNLLAEFSDAPDVIDALDMSHAMFNRAIETFKASAALTRLGQYPTY